MGILGIFCGIWVYIWGWIKHKQLRLARIMLLWTITILLPPLVAFGLPFFVAGDMQSIAEQIARLSGIPIKKSAEKSHKKRVILRPYKTASKRVPGKKGVTRKPPSYDYEIKKLDSLISRDGNNATAFYNRGWLYASKGNDQQAIKDYTQVIRISRSYGDAYYNRGLLYVKMKKYDLAIKDFSQAMKYSPSLIDAYCNRANAYYEQGNSKMAIRDYTAALKIRPNDGDLYYNRSIAYLSKGDKLKAAADSKQAARLGKKKAVTPAIQKGKKQAARKIPSATPLSVIWRKDLRKVKIPDVTARGMIHGEEFVAESAKIENGILTIRDGEGIFPNHAVTIFLFLKKGESAEGKSYDIVSTSGFGSPHVHMKWKPANSKIPKSDVFMKNYSMRLDFAKTQNGKLPGKIYLCMPDKMKSFVVGSFGAAVKGQGKRTRPKE